MSNSLLASLLVLLCYSVPATAVGVAGSDAGAAPRGGPVTVVVPWAPGGDTTLMFQQFSVALSRALERPVVVQNLAGGDGATGAAKVKSSVPDGSTLLAMHESLLGAYHAGISEVKPSDLEPVCLVSTSYSILGTRAGARWKSLAELLEDARKHPRTIRFGGTLGSSSFLLPALVAHAAKVELTFVPLDGTAQRYAALQAGNIDLAEMNVPGNKGLRGSGEVTVLAYAGPQRLAALPGIPTLKELHLAGEFGLRRGLMAPKGTPPAVLDALESACAKAAQDPELIRQTKALDATVTYLGRADFAALLGKLDAEVAGDLRAVGAYRR